MVIIDFEKEIRDFSSGIIASFGFDDLTCKLIVHLFIEPEEISLEELAQRTGYSVPSISTKMKVLSQIGGIRRIKKPGSRKIHFYMEKDVRKLVSSKIDTVIRQEIEPVKTEVPKILERYSHLPEEGSEREKSQYMIMKDYLDNMKKLETIMKDVKKRIQE